MSPAFPPTAIAAPTYGEANGPRTSPDINLISKAIPVFMCIISGHRISIPEHEDRLHIFERPVFSSWEAGPDGRSDPGVYPPGRRGSTISGQFNWNLTSAPCATVNPRPILQRPNLSRTNTIEEGGRVQRLKGCKYVFNCYIGGTFGTVWSALRRGYIKVSLKT